MKRKKETPGIDNLTLPEQKQNTPLKNTFNKLNIMKNKNFYIKYKTRENNLIHVINSLYDWKCFNIADKKDHKRTDITEIVEIQNLPYDCTGLFQHCSSLVKITKDIDTSHVILMDSMLRSCYKFNQDISSWNVDKVEDMAGMFSACYKFNQDISSWNVKNVEDMGCMFAHCHNFNQDISNWNVDKVISMYGMFYCAFDFNHNISNWNVDKVEYYDFFAINSLIHGTKKLPKFR